MSSASLTTPAASQFVESWGSLGVLWGLNRSMARIHALFLVTDEPIELDQVARVLNISRGNASMCLKELRNWGVIQRVHKTGDRQDYYVAEPDVWTTFFRIAVERKKREFDPALNNLRHLLAEEDFSDSPKTQKRLEEMEELFSTANTILGALLANETAGRKALGLLKRVLPKS
ncbi:MAG: ArsR family transcriptional regulator [Fibrobacteres bacterium]|nr:ArsR family transcriptional regulator [Fibrobacterota bacterium]MBK9575977.1 ArsR family transcriptional regulator [Fibrobacterota bacterium]QQS05038.1 MAG: ArsR family transcriptional regulator [Fibrobacterota bacterium]